ncbi:MAG: hypothetical protein AAGI69_29240 [Cyanobacteria bacterium P01_H01_bin.21]
MLLSTFELLLKRITPNPGTVGGSDRSILQGYFLNLSNPTTSNLRIRLRFNATTPSLNPGQLLDILDTTGINDFTGALVPDGPNRFRYDFTLNAGDTGLFILQPNILSLNPAVDQVEVRGFVEVFIVVPFFGLPRPLLLTPEHRGTFLPSPGGNGEFDQLIVSLPTATGGSLMEVDTISSFVLEPPVLVPTPLPQPITPITPVTVENPTNGDAAQATLPQILTTMAQRIEAIESRLPVASN